MSASDNADNHMTSKLILTLCVLIFGAVVPMLEINATHVFNPLWPEHARLHEVWQLVSNSALAALCLYLAWGRNDVRLASVIALCVSAGFLGSVFLADTYGGSMRHTDGSEIAVGGVNVAVLVMAVVTAALVGIALRARRST
jgi:hypothetical protein